MRHTFLFICFCLSINAFSQQEIALGNLGHLWQSNRLNPAYIQPNKVSVNLGNTFFNAQVSGFDIENAYSIRNDTLFLSASNIFGEDNDVRSNIESTPIAVEFRVAKNTTVGIDYSITNNINLNFNNGFSDLLFRGNAAFIDEVKVATVNTHLNAYGSLGLRFATKINEQWQVGAKVRYHTGVIHLNTDENRNSISVNTSSTGYDLTLATDYQLSASEPFRYENGTFVTDGETDGFQSNGFGIDLGVQYNMSEKLSLGASIIDLGSMTLKKPTTLTSMNEATYSGQNAEDLDNDDVSISTELDTFLTNFDFVSSDEEVKYSTPTRLVLHGNYILDENWRFGATIINEWYNNQSKFGLSLGANYAIIPEYINVGLSYTSRNGSNNNLGLNLTLAVLPFEVFLVTDNITGIGGLDNVNARVGMNLRFGNPKKPKLENRDAIY